MKARWIIGSAALLAAATALAQPYPSRSIRIVANSAPGASIDISARILANWLGTRLKQSAVVENRPGGGGTIGGEAVVKSPADGYTLLVASHNTSYNNLFVKDISYEWTKDLVPIAKIAGSGYAITVPLAVPARTLAEFVAYAKANPGKLNHGLAGSNVPEMEDVKMRLGLQVERVMYKGGAPLTQAISVNEVQLMFAGVFQGIQLRDSGKARVLAYTGLRRHASLPDVPALSELGFPNYEAGFWIGVFAPGATPAEIVTKLNAEVNEMNRAPDTLKRYEAQGYEAYSVTPAEMRAEMLELRRRASGIVAALGIKPE
jgi:tripartite-type tricarboxylate transporter receptor subunit TctC